MGYLNFVTLNFRTLKMASWIPSRDCFKPLQEVLSYRLYYNSTIRNGVHRARFWIINCTQCSHSWKLQEVRPVHGYNFFLIMQRIKTLRQIQACLWRLFAKEGYWIDATQWMISFRGTIGVMQHLTISVSRRRYRGRIRPRSNAVLHTSRTKLNQLGSCEVDWFYLERLRRSSRLANRE